MKKKTMMPLTIEEQKEIFAGWNSSGDDFRDHDHYIEQVDLTGPGHGGGDSLPNFFPDNHNDTGGHDDYYGGGGSGSGGDHSGPIVYQIDIPQLDMHKSKSPSSNGQGETWAALAGIVGGIAEIVGGIAAAETGVGVVLIIDGVSRTGFELAKFIDSFKDNHQEIPSNLGEGIAIGFAGEENAVTGRLINDIVIALIDGGVYPDAEHAVHALQQSHYIEGVVSGINSYSGAQDAVDYFNHYINDSSGGGGQDVNVTIEW
ncbi:hypothetical protein [Elizabethkingia anophelis]|uniref:hypothetical protein n=2 Tax=Elizabethkingia anophelis TaxID=1117645 RepID=UPI001DB2E4AF|nr:hypothetical protein [Elizabethkingia anophelis]EKW9480170.1 hypothetical protein [Elizabethkingia anophelis]EKX6443703.1 hypothetical protein [Elizabethkingia anophelis]EKX6447711.1 hypothetical protein [Elizabethkingia anophelis]EKX6474052.1 hypothetical protein [Elizabethkingia anophelis]